MRSMRNAMPCSSLSPQARCRSGRQSTHVERHQECVFLNSARGLCQSDTGSEICTPLQWDPLCLSQGVQGAVAILLQELHDVLPGHPLSPVHYRPNVKREIFCNYHAHLRSSWAGLSPLVKLSILPLSMEGSFAPDLHGSRSKQSVTSSTAL